ncbi:MAG: iron ABC transporter permease [Candidatus Hydrogenedentes bacterium]|nr:iron ABC transporter permease [Candidatus Hydrogenedentota bacterium]
MSRRANPSFLDRSLLFGCLAALALTVLYPTARMAWGALTHWNASTLFNSAAIVNTIVLSFASVAASGVVGTAAALWLARYRFPGRNAVAALMYLPFTLPPLVGVVSFYYIIGRDGLVTRFIERYTGVEPWFLEGPWAILAVHTYSFFVFFYAMVSAALDTMDYAQAEAARTLGATPAYVFRRVTLPQLRPALMGASLLTFMSSAASFSAPYFFGNNFPVLSTQIYEERTQFNDDAVLTLTVVLAFISLMGIALFRGRRPAAAPASKGVRVPPRSTAGRVAAVGGAMVAAIVLLLPHLNIIALSFTDHAAWGASLLPHQFTIENYRHVFSEASAFRPVVNSTWMSTVAALATVLIGLPAAYLIGRRKGGARLVNTIVMIPWALPGTVIAINLIVAFNDPWLALYGTAFMLPLAYFIRAVPLFTRMLAAPIETFDVTLLEAGRTLGATPAYCFWRIVTPMLGPALIAAAALVFAVSLGEFVASILLYSPDGIPISVQINMEWRGAGIGAAFAYSVFLMLMLTMTFLLARRFSSRIM